jgi:arabinosaccharide transport system substrate-binding protein
MNLADRFPFGKAPFFLTVVAVVSTLCVLYTQGRKAQAKPDLTFAIYASNHVESYQKAIAPFERKHGVQVSLQLVHNRALQTRLQNAMLAGTEVPDLVEMGAGEISYFTRGPLKDVGFVDLTDRLEREGLRSRLVESRLSIWSSRQRVFALPHDVHPVGLMYRADLVEALGIDVSTLTTWDAFVEAGKKVVRDLDGDGVIDRYMIDMPTSAFWGIGILLLQQDISLFDENGKILFDQPKTVDTILWYLRQTQSKDRVAFECGWGQSLLKAMSDGLALFYFAPDWRTHTTVMDMPRLKGKLKVMPLPAWQPGGRRTSVWGGSGLAIPKSNPNVELAWELAKVLYFDKAALGERFRYTGILPPLKDAWNLPEFNEPKPFFGGQRLGTLYAELAAEAPADWSTPYKQQAEGKVSEVFFRATTYFKERGETGLREFVTRELAIARAALQKDIDRNVFTRQ